jgi:methyl-accepting chemotaxis protein
MTTGYLVAIVIFGLISILSLILVLLRGDELTELKNDIYEMSIEIEDLEDEYQNIKSNFIEFVECVKDDMIDINKFYDDFIEHQNSKWQMVQEFTEESDENFDKIAEEFESISKSSCEFVTDIDKRLTNIIKAQLATNEALQKLETSFLAENFCETVKRKKAKK